jgi:predicted P-loop ATPase/GTPase
VKLFKRRLKMEIDIEYKEAKIIDFCTIQIEGTKEIIEVESFKDIYRYVETDMYIIIINGSIGVILDGETRAELLEDLCK